jgi:nitrogen fixation/metabolism regulation signal transduction histidine kinase
MNLDIENKILIPFLLLVIVPVIAVGIFSYKGNYRLLRENIIEELEVDLSEISNIIAENNQLETEDLIKKIKQIKNNDLLFVDFRGQTIYSDYKQVNSQLSSQIQRKTGDRDELFEISGNGQNNFFLFYRIPSKKWYIGTKVALNTITSSLLEIQKYTILVAIIFAIIAVELTIAIAYNISKPIKKLAQFCNNFSEGNYDAEVKLDRQDEIGTLANAFNNMINQVNKSTKELKKMKEINEDILRSTTTGIITIDNFGDVISVNRAARYILQEDGSVRQDIFARLVYLSKRCLDEQYYHDDIINFFTDQGRKKVIEVNTSYLTDEQGKVNGALCSFNDVTKRKKIEERMEQVDRLSSLGELAAGLAHEIRNPLTGIKTSVQVLAGRLKDKESSQVLFDNIISEIKRMNRLVSDILNFAKPGEPHFEIIDMKTLVKDSISLMEEHFKSNNIKLETNFTEKNVRVKIDPDQFKQILINLFMNSIKAMEDKRRLFININRNQEKVCIIIEDTGKGISEENLDNIFEPFYSTYSEGAGLGLSVVKRLVIENNGMINVNSQLNEGAKFIINLPHYRGNKINE